MAKAKPLSKKQIQDQVIAALLNSIQPATAPIGATPTDALGTEPTQVIIQVKQADGTYIPVITSASPPLQYSNGALSLSQPFTQTSPLFSTPQLAQDVPAPAVGLLDMLGPNKALIIAAGATIAAFAIMGKR